MGMTTNLTLKFEGAPACIDCQRAGHPVCDHVGFHEEAWAYMRGTAVHVPGLDTAYEHILRKVTISGDRKTVTLTVETSRPAYTDLARHLSTLHTPKASVRGVHHETGDVLAEGRFDAFLRVGETVYVNGTPHFVQHVDHPNRSEFGACDSADVQVARLMPTPVVAIQQSM